MKIFNDIKRYLEHLEIRIRHILSHWPLVYAFLGSVGVVLIWRGVWHIADDWGMSGTVSLIIGILLSVVTGLFVSFFVGDQIIISGIRSEKRIDEKTEEEIQKEEVSLREIKKDLKEIKEEIEDIEENQA